MSSHQMTLVGEIQFKDDAPQKVIKAALQGLLDAYYHDYEVMQLVGPTDQLGWPMRVFLSESGNINEVSFDMSFYAKEYEIADALENFTSALNPYVEGAGFLLAQDHDTGDSDNACWNVWYGQGQALVDAKRDYGWMEVMDALKAHEFSHEEIKAVADALGMPAPVAVQRATPSSV